MLSDIRRGFRGDDALLRHWRYYIFCSGSAYDKLSTKGRGRFRSYFCAMRERRTITRKWRIQEVFENKFLIKN